jgi:hypothetical protein
MKGALSLETAERILAMRSLLLVAFLSMVSLTVGPGVVEAQIAPISQARSVDASVFGVTTNYVAANFSDLIQNVSISSNDVGSGMAGSGSAGQVSDIRPSFIQGGGSAQAGGNQGAQGSGSSSCSVTFQTSSNFVYTLSGSLSRNAVLNNSPAPFVTLSGSTGTIFFVNYSVSSNGVSFSQNGYLSPGQYTVSGSAGAIAGGGGGNTSFNFNFIVSPPPPSEITAVARQSNDVRVTWTSFPGTTNIVQATAGTTHGSYSNNFSDISPLIVVGNSGITNYLDAGGATNFPARYYRVRMPGS